MELEKLSIDDLLNEMEYNDGNDILAVREEIKKRAGVVNLSNVVRQLPPFEDERIYKSVCAKIIKDWITIGWHSNSSIAGEKTMAMEQMRDKIWEFYELRRRQSA